MQQDRPARIVMDILIRNSLSVTYPASATIARASDTSWGGEPVARHGCWMLAIHAAEMIDPVIEARPG